MKRLIKLQWKMLIYMLLFIIGILAFILVFQTRLMADFYHTIKINQIQSAATNVADVVDSDDLDKYVENVSKQDDLCIRIVGSQGDIFEPNSQGCPLNMLTYNDLANYYILAATNDGDYMQESSEGLMVYRPNQDEFQVKEGQIRNMTYIKLIESNLILIYGTTSFSSTTYVALKYLMYIISIIVILATILMSFLFSKKIVKPIETINNAAKTLKDGTYECDPENEYQEAHDLNETLKKTADDLKKADKAKRDLISNVSHDLRTPLTMISGYGQMMIDLPEEKTEENLKVIVDESNRLNQLVNDLLSLSKLQDGKIDLEPSEFDIAKLLKETTFNYQRMNPEIEITYRGLDECMVTADESKIQQVIHNFINNAINYGENKPIEIRLEKENDVKISVTDHGQGIAEDDLVNIWDRYYKVDKAHFRSQVGSGIGLNIAKEILDLHKAEYGVDSVLNEGSTFWFKLK